MSRPLASTPQDWMEMIRIRMDHSMRTGVEEQVMAHLDQVRRSGDRPRVDVRRHLTVTNDLLIVLQWETVPEAGGSSLAYSLCREFETYGLVDHTVWSADGFAGRKRARNREDLSPHPSTSEEKRP